MSTEYEAAAADPTFCIPPLKIRRLVDTLFLEAGSDVESIAAAAIPTGVLAQLNAFAAYIANVPQCNVLMIHDCPSCRVRNQRGNLVDTDNGTQCWKC